MYIEVDFSRSTDIPKRLYKFFDLENLEEQKINLKLQNFRSWKEAKATGG